MSILTDIEKIHSPSFGATLLGFFLMFAPGISYIFFFERELIMGIDVFKLLLLSIAIFAPFFILNFFCAAIQKMHENRFNQDNAFFATFVGLIFSAAVLYLALLPAYLFDISFRNTILGALGLQLIIFVLSCVGAYTHSRERQVK
ncbi:MAG: hypothetical protein Q7S75_01565 [bacterium]|nr:hypothetical protein [bacterium]